MKLSNKSAEAWKAAGLAMFYLIIMTVSLIVSREMWHERGRTVDSLLWAGMAIIAALVCIYVVVSTRRRLR